MMAENKERKGLERDISMCGKSIVWFLVRLAYLLEQKVKNELAGLQRVDCLWDYQIDLRNSF